MSKANRLDPPQGSRSVRSGAEVGESGTVTEAETEYNYIPEKNLVRFCVITCGVRTVQTNGQAADVGLGQVSYVLHGHVCT